MPWLIEGALLGMIDKLQDREREKGAYLLPSMPLTARQAIQFYVRGEKKKEKTYSLAFCTLLHWRTMPLRTAAERAADDEKKIQVALAVVVALGLNQQGQPCQSLRSAAAQFDVSRSKLTAWYNGRKT